MIVAIVWISRQCLCDGQKCCSQVKLVILQAMSSDGGCQGGRLRATLCVQGVEQRHWENHTSSDLDLSNRNFAVAVFSLRIGCKSYA
eukprot:13464367-Heterocapsa_arctica.AAC.1